MPQTSKQNSKNRITTDGKLEPACAVRLENQLSALQDFVMMAQHDIMAHMHLTKEDYDKMIKLTDEEVAANKKPELNALNRLMYTMVDLDEARDELSKIIGKEHDDEINKSYR
jgi:hypothetical protein